MTPNSVAFLKPCDVQLGFEADLPDEGAHEGPVAPLRHEVGTHELIRSWMWRERLAEGDSVLQTGHSCVEAIINDGNLDEFYIWPIGTYEDFGKVSH